MSPDENSVKSSRHGLNSFIKLFKLGSYSLRFYENKGQHLNICKSQMYFFKILQILLLFCKRLSQKHSQ